MELVITAQIEIEDEYASQSDDVVSDLLGEFVKVKSGLFENIAMGHITVVQKIPRKDS
jgi:hypothetical protein